MANGLSDRQGEIRRLQPSILYFRHQPYATSSLKNEGLW